MVALSSFRLAAKTVRIHQKRGFGAKASLFKTKVYWENELS
jgi:hypothetical protein